MYAQEFLSAFHCGSVLACVLNIKARYKGNRVFLWCERDPLTAREKGRDRNCNISEGIVFHMIDSRVCFISSFYYYWDRSRGG